MDIRADKNELKELKSLYSNLWIQAEKKLSDPLRNGYNPENCRISGLINAQNNRWEACLLRLEEALTQGVTDCQVLDAFGEAAYQTGTPEALLPFETLYLDPLVSIHMARALMMVGEIRGAKFYALRARPSLLKNAVLAMLGIKGNIQQAIASMLQFEFDPVRKDETTNMLNLSYPEFWQALSAIADAAGKQDLIRLAEQRTKALAYKNPTIHFNQAVRLLAQGEYRAGWKLYDWRLVPGSPCALPTEFHNAPMWEGQSLKGKKLLVILDNGLGDQMFALRFIKPLLMEVDSIEIIAPSDIYSLVESSFPNIRVHFKETAHSPNYWKSNKLPDYWIYALSIPSRTELGIPQRGINTGGHLTAPTDLVNKYQIQLLEKNPAQLPVYGIVWHGDVRTAAMRTRAYSIQEFLNEIRVQVNPCVILNLQKDITQEERTYLHNFCTENKYIALDVSSMLINFAHTAAWIKNTDRIFSCDTSVAHASGGLNHPTTVLVRNPTIWHWLIEANSNEIERLKPLPQNRKKNGQSVWYDSVQVQHSLVPEIPYMFEIREDEERAALF